MCHSCDTVTPDQCDASGSCCAADFLDQCPSNPAECVVPKPCDLSKCECDGVSLSSLKGGGAGKVYTLPADAEGYAYSVSICGT